MDEGKKYAHLDSLEKNIQIAIWLNKGEHPIYTMIDVSAELIKFSTSVNHDDEWISKARNIVDKFFEIKIK